MVPRPDGAAAGQLVLHRPVKPLVSRAGNTAGPGRSNRVKEDGLKLASKLKARFALGLAGVALVTGGAVVAPAALQAPGSTAEAYSTSSCRTDYKYSYGQKYSFTSCWRNYSWWQEVFQGGHDGWWRKQNYPYPGGWYYVGKTWYFVY